MPRRPHPIFFIVIGIAFTLVALGLNMGSGSEETEDPTPTLVQETMPAIDTQVPTLPLPSATPVPQTPTPEPASTALPDRTSCAAITGTAYRSEAERQWFIANCTLGESAPPSDEAS